ncbi:hypothetical protein L1787_10495 [Acuticoccus sp. M5D2P5]|uniref:hypothetical protein n=1 Tax=Acuticoccus kalidii TaxID=2910977 RepID=UPI001F3E3B77|nr:hypothetical protein [Acuticoccus kalidii]MCF3933843.1 hypothetical protein [Acuticoccus kalidii]
MRIRRLSWLSPLGFLSARAWQVGPGRIEGAVSCRLPIALTLVAGLVLGGCAARDAQQASAGKSAIVGLTKTQVRMCAGLPNRRVEGDDESDEIWSYERDIAGGASVTLPTLQTLMVPIPGPSFNQSNTAYCHAQVRFKQNKAVEVAYAGATTVMGATDAACAQIVQGCVSYEPPKDDAASPAKPKVTK